MDTILKVKSIIAINNLPVRKNRKLLLNSAFLYPNENIVVYAEVNRGHHIFNVTFDIIDFPLEDKKNHKYTLNGRITGSDELIFVSSEFVFLKDGEICFSIILNKSPRGFLFIDEDIIWVISISDTETNMSVQNTKIRLYFLPKLPLDANTGVAIESLNFTNQAFLKGKSYGNFIDGEFINRSGYTNPLNDVTDIANWMFSRKEKAIYDTYQGAYYFVSFTSFNDITLNYNGILNATTSQKCNCYDMAAFFQYQVKYSVGIYVYFDYIEPFGYLKLTSLIGWGLCNNPFFSNPLFDPSQICDETISNRSCFGNHAFIYLLNYGVVADACGGPHTGNESKQQYINNAIDLNYPTPPSIKPGTLNNISDNKGVTNVTMSLKADDAFDKINLLDFIKSVNLNHSMLKTELIFIQNFPDIQECINVGKNWKVLEDEIYSDFPIAIKHTLLSDNHRSIELKTWVASDSTKTALNQYLALGSNHSMPSPIFIEGPVNLGESSGKFESGDYTRYIWLLNNVVFDLKTTNFSSEVVQEIALWINEIILPKINQVKENSFPVINEIKISSTNIKIDDTLLIEINCSKELKLFIEGDHPGLYILEEKPDSFSFIARKKSLNKFTISALNPNTLMQSKQDIVICVE